MAEERVCGVDREVLEKFLVCLRDRYSRADKANYFLEINEGESGLSVAITNQRDALSHFVSVLSKPDGTTEEQYEQLGNAVEHLRRAVLEPYERAVSSRADKIRQLYEQYKATVLTLPRLNARLPGAPQLSEIDGKLRAIGKLREQGRAAKSLNAWNAEWETGVEKLIEAYSQLSDLKSELEGFVTQAAQMRESDDNAARSRATTILWTVIGIIAGILIAAIFNVLDSMTSATAHG